MSSWPQMVRDRDGDVWIEFMAGWIQADSVSYGAGAPFRSIQYVTEKYGPLTAAVIA